jgi:hypothetical protein
VVNLPYNQQVIQSYKYFLGVPLFVTSTNSRKSKAARLRVSSLLLFQTCGQHIEAQNGFSWDKTDRERRSVTILFKAS